MKFSLTGESGPIATLAGLNALVEQALRITHTAEGVQGQGGADPQAVAVKVRTTPTGKIRELVVSW